MHCLGIQAVIILSWLRSIINRTSILMELPKFTMIGFLVAVFLSCHFTTYAQLQQYAHQTEDEENKRALHYQFPAFVQGSIILNTGDTVSKLMNYNLVTEEIIVDLGRMKTAYPWSEKVECISIGASKYHFLEDQIYELVVDGEVQLFLHQKQKMQRLGQNTGLGRSSIIDSKEVPPEKHLLYEMELPGTFELKKVNAWIVIRNGKKQLFERTGQVPGLFPEIKDELKKYIKRQKLRNFQEEDTKKLIQHCNELLASAQ